MHLPGLLHPFLCVNVVAPILIDKSIELPKKESASQFKDQVHAKSANPLNIEKILTKEEKATAKVKTLRAMSLRVSAISTSSKRKTALHCF